MRIPTVKIKSNNKQGYIIINECDFNNDKHILFGDENKGDENKTNNKSTIKKTNRKS